MAHRIGPSVGEPRRPCRTGLDGKYTPAKKTVMDDARDTRTASLKKETETREGRRAKEHTKKEAATAWLREKHIPGISEMREAAQRKEASRGDVETSRQYAQGDGT